MSHNAKEAPFFIQPLHPIRPPGTRVSVRGAEILQRMNRDIQQLNQLITAYNRADNRKDRVGKLQLLDRERQRLDDEYGDIVVSAVPDYQTNVYVALQHAMYQQRRLLHVDSNYQMLAIFQADSGRELSDILDSMTTEEVTQIIQVLSTAKAKTIRKSLSAIAPLNHSYQALLIQHDIDFIGGANSKNFSFVNRQNAQRIIMKVENRLDTPKKEERELRTALSNEKDETSFLVREWSDRRVVYEDPTSHKMQARRLIVMDCSQGRTLEDLPLEADIPAQQQLAVDIALAQIMVYKKMHLLGKTWTDGKGENIFFYRDPLTQHMRAEIADCKAIFSCDPRLGVMPPDDGYLHTPGSTAPELMTKQTNPINVDKAAAYTIGRNLYESLLKFVPKAYIKYFTPTASGQCPYEAIELDQNYFKHAIFAEPYQSLVQSLVNADPNARISLDELYLQLLEIKYAQHPNVVQYQHINQNIRQILAFDLDDTEKLLRSEFIYKCYQALLSSAVDLDKMNNRLERVLQRYSARPPTTIYKTALDTHKKGEKPKDQKDTGLEIG